MKLPQRLTKARKRLDLSQADVADQVGVSAGTVAGWETESEHHHGIRMQLVPKVAEVLKLSPKTILADMAEDAAERQRAAALAAS